VEMVAAHIQAHRKDEPPIEFIPSSGIIVHAIDNTYFYVLEGGMESGEPSVMILAVSKDGVGVAVETSLDKFVMAGIGMMALAEQGWGWKRPEGHASILPTLSDEKRKELLESIKKELESFDD